MKIRYRVNIQFGKYKFTIFTRSIVYIDFLMKEFFVLKMNEITHFVYLNEYSKVIKIIFKDYIHRNDEFFPFYINTKYTENDNKIFTCDYEKIIDKIT